MNKILLSIIFTGIQVFCFAQDYQIESIDSSLTKDAYSVIRKNVTNIEVNGTQEMSIQYHKAISILNKEHLKYANVYVSYDPNINLSKIEINVYNKDGLLIEKVKQGDIQDYSSFDNNIADDNRFKFYDASGFKLPFTVETIYRKVKNGFLGIPTWGPQFTTNLSIEYAKISVKSNNNEIRSKELNFSGLSDKNQNESSWTLKDLPIVSDEDYMPEDYEVFPMVFFAPSKFQYDKVEGEFSDWASIGQWNYNLITSVSELDDEVKNFAQELKGNISDKRQLVFELYKYLQSNTRYVSIQLGIGGWRPFSPNYVYEKGYGDCKALSNYMRSLLKEVDIESYYTIIGSGTPSMFLEDFATVTGQANHVIVCVPFEKDTIWLECTSQKIQPGYIGQSNSNRNVLLVTPEGGKIVKTPKYDSQFNRRKFNLKVDLSENGNATINSSNLWKGFHYSNLSGLLSVSKEELDNAFLEWLDASSPKIVKNNISDLEADTPTIQQDLVVEIPNYAKKVGSRLIVKLNPLVGLQMKPEENNDRKNDILVYTDKSYKSSISINIPEGYKIEKLPKNIDQTSEFGSIQYSIEVNEKFFTINKEIIILSGKFSAQKHQEWFNFMSAIDKVEKSKAVLRKIE